MRNKSEVMAKLDEKVLSNIKSQYPFMYKHVLVDIRGDIERISEEMSSDDLTDTVNESIHTECLDQYHSATSGSMTYEEANAIVEDHKKRMGWIEELYEDLGLGDLPK